jgi:hypothetical protein
MFAQLSWTLSSASCSAAKHCRSLDPNEFSDCRSFVPNEFSRFLGWDNRAKMDPQARLRLRWLFAELDPFAVERTSLIDSLIGVRAEIVTLSLQQVGR